MKIAMIVKKLHYGGAYKMFMWLASSLANKGNEVLIFTYMPCDIKSLPKNINWIKRDLEGASFYAKYKTYKNIIKEHRPACSISFLLDANVLNILSCLNTSTKSVVCERNDPFKPHYYKLRLAEPLFRLADGAVFQLDKVREYYSMIKKTTVVISNPIPNKDYAPIKSFSDRDNVIVTLGRLDIFQKRQDVLLEAFVKFRNIYPLFKLIIYGDGKDKPRLEKIINQLNLQDNVVLAGVTNNPYEAMKNAKFFILTSDFEGIPNALMEAMSIGLPCISTDCSPGGASLLIEDGVNGFLVPKNDPDVLFLKMQYVIKNTDRMDYIGNNAKKVKERFSEFEIIKQWTNYLNSIVSI